MAFFRPVAVPACPVVAPGGRGSRGPGLSFLVVGVVSCWSAGGVSVQAGDRGGQLAGPGPGRGQAQPHAAAAAHQPARRRRTGAAAAAAAWAPRPGRACGGRASRSRPAVRRPSLPARATAGSARSRATAGRGARCLWRTRRRSRAGSCASASLVTSMCSLAVSDPAFPGRSTMASGSPPVPAPGRRTRRGDGIHRSRQEKLSPSRCPRSRSSRRGRP